MLAQPQSSFGHRRKLQTVPGKDSPRDGAPTHLRSNFSSIQRAVLSSFDYAQTTAFFVAFLISFPAEPAPEKKQA